jgi:hypothetical protein
MHEIRGERGRLSQLPAEPPDARTQQIAGERRAVGGPASESADASWETENAGPPYEGCRLVAVTSTFMADRRPPS